MSGLTKFLAPTTLLVLAAACGVGPPAAPAQNGGATPATPATPAYVELDGIILATGQELSPLVIELASGATIPVDGAAAPMLLRVAGARITVRGREFDGLLTVDNFTVLEVHGRPVADGFVEMVDDGYQLRLMDGGTYHVDAPADLAACVGSRIWITTDSPVAPVEFGVINERQ